MTIDWERVQEVFAAATEMPTAERPAYLADRSISLEERAEVEQLLRSDDIAGDFLGTSLFGPLTEMLPADFEAPVYGAVGQKVGPYRLVRVIGEGGMGAVYLAIRGDQEYQKQVAIKLLHRSHDRDALARFRTERQMLAGLEHPNIARLYDGGTDNGRPYLIMEYVEGLRIDAYCQEADLKHEDRIRLFQQVCSAVSYAHSNLLVHRDLKPANILVTVDGIPKLLDFGIAKSLENDAAVTVSGHRPMTPAYASPEQVSGSAITTASDVYSLGVLLFGLLTGKSPYKLEDSDDVTLQLAIRDQAIARPSVSVDDDGISRQLQGDLDTIVLKALRKEPEHRYVSVGALSDDLERHLDHLPIHARPAALSYQVRKFVRRHRPEVVATIVGFALLVGFLVALVRQTQQANEQSEIAGAERDRAERVLGVMIDAFKASDPEVARGKELTAREILDRGADKVRIQLAGDPDAKATLLAAMGEVYVSLGEFDHAEPLMKEALELRSGGDEEAVSLYQLGELEWWRRSYGAAESYYRGALAAMPQEEEAIQYGQALRGLGLTLERQGSDEAEGLLKKALEIKERHYQQTDSELLRVKEGLGRDANRRGSYSKAEALFREVVAARYPDGPGPALGRSLAGLGIVRFRQGALEEARGLLEKALLILRDAMEDNAFVAEILGKLVAVRIRLGDDLGAELAIRDILRILPAEHPGSGTALHNLGMILARRGDLAEAEVAAKEALQVRRLVFGDVNEHVALSLCQLGGIALESSSSKAAREHYQECVTMMESVHPVNHPQVGFALLGLGRSIEALEGCSAAEPWFQRAFRLRRESLGDDHFQTALAAMSLGSCLGNLGMNVDAERLLVEAMTALRSQGFAEDDPRICDAAARLRAFYVRHSREEELQAAVLSACTSS